MPNTLATLVLFSWPLVAWVLFSRYRVTIALPATVIFGYLFIPERVSFDLPLLPAIDKFFMPSVSAAILLAVHDGRAARALRRQNRRLQEQARRAPAQEAPEKTRPAAARPLRAASRIARIVPLILGVLMLAPLLTWITNQDALIYGPRYLKGLGVYDVFSMVLALAITLLPFWLARHRLGTAEARTDLLKVFAIAGLVYSVLVIWEARMSPQLNRDLYGFFAHSWRQHIREGFRPIVFLGHGLRVGIFLCMALLASATLARGNVNGRRVRWLAATAWLLVCLYFSRNLGALLIALPLTAAILITPKRLQFLLAGTLAGIILIYPLARGSGLIPTERITSWVSTISADRAQSFEYRLKNEDILLDKANQKPLTGWGVWGRSRVYNPETGGDMSTTDGSWIIVIGAYGWIGYLGEFGLLCVGVILMWRRHQKFGLDVLDAGLAIVLVANLVDLIPNSSSMPVMWLLAGAVWARLEYAAAHPPRPVSARRARLRPATGSLRVGHGAEEPAG